MNCLSTSEKDVLVLPSAIASDIAFKGSSSLKNSDFSQYNFIAGPVFHPDIKHWSLIFIDVTTAEFFYFDPMTENPSYRQFCIYQNWLKFCKKDPFMSSIRWTNQVDIPHQIQSDNFSCGLFVCRYFYCLKKKDFISLTHNVNLDDFRKEIDKVFQSFNTLKEYFCCFIMLGYFLVLSIFFALLLVLYCLILLMSASVIIYKCCFLLDYN